MRHASTLCLCSALMALASSAQAAIEVSFIEDAPKDRFVIINTSTCTLADLQIMIDLGPSAGGLYFDKGYPLSSTGHSMPLWSRSTKCLSLVQTTQQLGANSLIGFILKKPADPTWKA